MSLVHVHFRSRVLIRDTAFSAIVPDDAPPPWPVTYLLHGLSDDHTKWQRMTAVERLAQRHGLMIVMPDGGRGGYANNVRGPRWFDYLVEDVIGGVERHFRVRTDRGGRSVGGLSMGGYGAMLLGLRRPDLFGSVVSHSGALLWGRVAARDYRGGLHDREYEDVFGPEPAGGENDLLALAKGRAEEGVQLPAMRLDCGRDDYILRYTTEVHRGLEALGVPHEFELFDGGHAWDYWSARLPEALAFHARHVTPAPAGRRR